MAFGTVSAAGDVPEKSMNHSSETPQPLTPCFSRHFSSALALCWAFLPGLALAQEPPLGKLSTEAAAPHTKDTGDATADYAGARATRLSLSLGERYRELPYMKRYAPEKFQWEVGLFTGILFPSEEHNLKVQVLPRDEYSSVAGELGGRLGFYPWAFLGGEVEAWAGGASTEATNYSAVFYAIRGHVIAQLPFHSVVPFALFGAGTLGASSETMGHDRDPAIHFGAGVKVPFNHRVSARFDLRDVLTQKGNGAAGGKQTHHPELQLGVTFTFERTPPPLPRDRDFDGLFDQEDQCPDVGALTLDGCPLDTDDDGIVDAEDHCPQEFGPAPHGCPVLDADSDGIVIPVDQCPTEAGVSPDGCPEKDPDNDGLEGQADGCPQGAETRNGFEDDDGCPDQVPEAVSSLAGLASEIRFQKGTAKLVEGSTAGLQTAGRILLEHPSVRLEVISPTSGEASSAGSHLGQERAIVVRQFLIGQGVADDRIVVRAAGSSEPLEESRGKTTSVQNERVEFKILVQP